MDKTKWTFFQRGRQSGPWYMKGCSACLICREMELRTTRDHLIPVRMVSSGRYVTGASEVVEKREPLYSCQSNRGLNCAGPLGCFQ